MKIVSFHHSGTITYGVVDGDRVIPASADFVTRYPNVQEVLAAKALDQLSADVSASSRYIPLEGLSYARPLPDSARVICVGVNYPKRYPLDAPAPPPDHIILFAKLPGTLVAHGETLEVPPGEAADTFDYEGEIVLVIGKGGRYISRKNAWNHIAGYTIMDEGSVRGWQKHSIHAGKNFESSGSCGPWIVTADEIADPSAMVLETRLNGEQVQHTTAGEMVFPIPELIEYISDTMTLQPGDMIATGSPEGSGGSRQPPRFLKLGDQLEIRVSGVGVLANKVG